MGGDRITHPAGGEGPYNSMVVRLDWCGEKDKIRREPYNSMGEKRSIKLRSSGDGKDPRGKSKLQPIGLEPTNLLPPIGASGSESHRGLRLRCPYPDNNQKSSEHVCDGRDCHI